MISRHMRTQTKKMEPRGNQTLGFLKIRDAGARDRGTFTCKVRRAGSRHGSSDQSLGADYLVSFSHSVLVCCLSSKWGKIIVIVDHCCYFGRFCSVLSGTKCSINKPLTIEQPLLAIFCVTDSQYVGRCSSWSVNKLATFDKLYQICH